MGMRSAWIFPNKRSGFAAPAAFLKTDPEVFRGACEALAGLDLRPELDKVKLPVLVLVGEIPPGLAHAAADTAAVHSLSPTTWLSGVRPKPTQGTDAFAGVTADQIAARHAALQLGR